MSDPTTDDDTWTAYVALVTEILSEMLDEPDLTIRGDAHLLHDIGLDSFGVLAFVTELEERLGVLLAATDDEPTLSAIHRAIRAGRPYPAGQLAGEAER